MKKFLKFTKNFGSNFTIKSYYYKILYKLTKKEKYIAKINDITLKFLEKNFLKYTSDEGSYDNLEKDYTTWLFWWQGIDENTPKIVKGCINSIKKYTKNVVIIDKNNLSKYVEIPKYILEKVENKIISLTHFSDILRVCLLEKYGGVWLDTTIYMNKDISDDIVGKPFYTNKFDLISRFATSIAKTDWSAFFLAGCKGNPIFKNLKNIFFEYWKKYDTQIHYFFVDFAIRLQYNNLKKVKEMIDLTPKNNKDIHNLMPILFDKYNKEYLDKMLQTTKIFKLSYKYDKKLENIDDTYFKKLF